MCKRSGYPTDLSDKQWLFIKALLPKPKSQPGH